MKDLPTLSYTATSKIAYPFITLSYRGGGGAGTLGLFGWGCAAGTLEPLTYTRATDCSSSEFFRPGAHQI